MIKHRSLIPNFNAFDPKTSFFLRNTNLTPSHLSMSLSVSTTPKEPIEFMLNQLDNPLGQNEDLN